MQLIDTILDRCGPSLAQIATHYYSLLIKATREYSYRNTSRSYRWPRELRELGVSDRVVFPGRVDRAAALQWQRALDVFVVPRRDREVTRSVTPLKLAEASACAVPVIASDLPALAELVDDGVTGLLVPPSDPAALAAEWDQVRQICVLD